MHILPELDMLTKGMVKIDNDKMRQAFEISVVAGETSYKSNLYFDWSVQAMTKRSLNIQITFKTARFISMEAEPELLRLILRDRYLFVSNMNLPMAKAYKKKSKSRRMMSSNQ